MFMEHPNMGWFRMFAIIRTGRWTISTSARVTTIPGLVFIAVPGFIPITLPSGIRAGIDHGVMATAMGIIQPGTIRFGTAAIGSTSRLHIRLKWLGTGESQRRDEP